jgi:hypothetical protein
MSIQQDRWPRQVSTQDPNDISRPVGLNGIETQNPQLLSHQPGDLGFIP